MVAAIIITTTDWGHAMLHQCKLISGALICPGFIWRKGRLANNIFVVVKIYILIMIICHLNRRGRVLNIS